MKMTAIHQKKRSGAPRWANRWIQSPRWLAGFLGAVLLCVVLFAVNAATGRVHPSTTWGLGYGIAAAAMVVAVLLYAVRRRTLRIRRLGRSWTYLQLHVYGGALFLMLVFMHTGFSLPHGVLTWWLYGLSIWVVVSGLLGILIQKWIPTVLNAGFSVEIHYDRVPELVDTIRNRSEKLVSGVDERIRAYYADHLAPTLAAPRPRLLYFFDVTGGIAERTRPFGTLRDIAAPDDRGAVDELQQLVRTKLEIDAHYTLQKALRGWLLLHVPFSIVLVGLLVVHVLTVLYY